MITILAVSSCGNDDEPTTKFNDITLSCGDSYSIPAGAGLSWTSSNELVASVTGNNVTAEHVGKATISSNKGSFKVTVTSTTSAYKEPCLIWGANKNTVKSFMNNYNGVTLYKDETSSITYSGTVTQTVLMVMYTFDNNKLKDSGVALNSTFVSTNTLTDFLTERYIPVSTDASKYRFYFINPDKGMAVVLQLTTVSNNVVYMIVYTPVDLSSRVNGNLEDLFDIDVNATTDCKPIFEEISRNM